MRWNSLATSLGFAAGAALLTGVLWPLMGHGRSVMPIWIGLSSIYALGLAPGRGADRRVRGLGAAVAVAGAGTVAALAGAGVQGVAVATTAALGAVRALWLHPGRGARGGWLELALGLGALAMAGFWLRGPGGGATALAASVWSYWLVQSLFFLFPGRAGAARGDGFEQARRQLLELLEEGG